MRFRLHRNGNFTYRLRSSRGEIEHVWGKHALRRQKAYVQVLCLLSWLVALENFVLWSMSANLCIGLFKNGIYI